MTIRLRPHHLLCMLTYAGKGYSPAFTANMTAIVGRIAGGEPIEIVSGADDICKPLLGEADPHCHRESVGERDQRAARDVGRLIGASVGPGTRLRLDGAEIAQLRTAFVKDDIRSACGGCEWRKLCSHVASAGFDISMLVS
ncbi:DUF1284 domain-containing protein [Martelella soudanensis]|uniref:DUF1284 domain-containing protein n=1 Tax=unclassified Martelella TaxID=2629616 RepID=UPI0015DFBA9C|nr:MULTISPECIES: DUF1284 domain-containing protein [unclassified Martelella]